LGDRELIFGGNIKTDRRKGGYNNVNWLQVASDRVYDRLWL